MIMSIYRSSLAGIGYDLLVRFTFSTVGGLDLLRQSALERMELHPGDKVLELGCGTGGFTKALVSKGLAVTAVDQSEPMLQRARSAVPHGSVSFELSEITVYSPKEQYDLVLFAFVLHELDINSRLKALSLARNALSPNGKILIVDHSIPKSGGLARAVSAFVHTFEPPSVVAWARGAWRNELPQAGLTVENHFDLAQGTAISIVARKAE